MTPSRAYNNLLSDYRHRWGSFMDLLQEHGGVRLVDLLPDMCFAIIDVTEEMERNISHLVQTCTKTVDGYNSPWYGGYSLSHGHYDEEYIDQNDLRRGYDTIMGRWSEFLWSFLNRAKYGAENLPYPGELNDSDLIHAFFRQAARQEGMERDNQSNNPVPETLPELSKATDQMFILTEHYFMSDDEVGRLIQQAVGRYLALGGKNERRFRKHVEDVVCVEIEPELYFYEAEEYDLSWEVDGEEQSMKSLPQIIEECEGRYFALMNDVMFHYLNSDGISGPFPVWNAPSSIRQTDTSNDIGVNDICVNDILVNDICVNDILVNDILVNDIPTPTVERMIFGRLDFS